MDDSQRTDHPGLEPGATPNTYLPMIRDARTDPQRLEHMYSSAIRAHETEQFTSAVETCYHESPDNLLYAAWYHRLHNAAPGEPHLALGGGWKLAVPFSVGLGLTLWLLSDPKWTFNRGIPYLVLLIAPVVAVFIIGFLTAVAKQRYATAAVVALALAAATAYVLVVPPRGGLAAYQTYLQLMLLHLPLLAWAGIGIAVLGWRSAARDRFAFLTKSIETIGTAGVAAIVGGIFVAITMGMFAALSVSVPNLLTRLLVAGGGGLIPVLAVATVYNPALGPSEQEFGRGFGKILTILMQALLPLTLIVLVIYLFVIPFNFWQPFVNRDVLIVYNVMLFAIMGLLLGVTPISVGALPARLQPWLRAGIVLLAGLVVLIGAYALAAVIYRTAQGTLTMNRLAVIGWNTINLVILITLLYRQLRATRATWTDALYATFRLGTVLYVAWGVIVVLTFPWLF